jgi:peptidyl-prolyl cis-trans isomerase D
MLGSFRNFSKSKFSAVFIFIVCIPFVFFGMGDIFSSGNTNNIAKINDKNISTEDFLTHVNTLEISPEYIRDNLDKNVIEELLSTLITSEILNLEVKSFNISLSENSLLKKIKNNKSFLDESGIFQRVKYEKFLLENNIAATIYENRLRNSETQKNLFDYIGAGTVTPKFLAEKFYQEQNRKIELEFINLNSFYVQKDQITQSKIDQFLKENENTLKVDYIDFRYAKINPKNLVGVDEYNQAFFDSIDQIEIDISNEVDFDNIVQKFDIESTSISNFKFSENASEIEKKIFNLKENSFDIIETENEYILYKIDQINQRSPDIKDDETKNEILELIFQQERFDYNKDLLSKIKNKNFSDIDFTKMHNENFETITLNSIKDADKFDPNSIKLLYSLPEKSFALIYESDNIYLAKIRKFINVQFNSNQYKNIMNEQKTNTKQRLLKSYDELLNDKYKVTLNKKTIERVKNYFQ